MAGLTVWYMLTVMQSFLAGSGHGGGGTEDDAPRDPAAFGAHYSLPQDELLNLFTVSTGDSWVARNWDSVSQWTADTALAVLLKDLKAAHLKGLEHNIPMPFNALSSTQLFHSMAKEPQADRTAR